MTEHSINLDHLARIKDGTGHSIFGPSSSHMWLACSGSLIPNIMMPDNAGIDAAYGTVAHSVTALWLQTDKRPDHLLGTNEFIESGDWGYLIDIDDEMLQYVEQAVDRSEWMPGDHLVEHRVDFSTYTPIPRQGGTLDFAAMSDGHAVLDDHKFGSAPENIVFAEENPQLMMYAIGLDKEFGPRFGFKTFTLRINQPILDHFDEWTVSRRRLLEFAEYMSVRAHAAWKIDAPRTPGPKQCRFCKVRSTCAANAKLQEDLVSAVFQDDTVQTVEQVQAFIHRLDDELAPFKLEKVIPGTLNTAQMAKLLPYRGMAESWWGSMAEELNRRAAHGEKIPGLKVVEGRSHRHWKNETTAAEALIELGLARDAIISESLVSPNKAGELLKKAGRRTKDIPELLRGQIYKPPGRATLVPLTDKRAAVEDVSALAFEDLTENPETEDSEGL